MSSNHGRVFQLVRHMPTGWEMYDEEESNKVSREYRM
jgi:hypothetical protein